MIVATEVGTAYVTLIPSAKGFASTMQRSVSGEISSAGTMMGTQLGDKTSTTMGSRLKSRASSIFSSLKVAGPLAAVAAGAAISKVLVSSIEEAREAAKVTARTEGVIKSMGDVAGVSAKEVADLAGAISLKAGIDDEEIQAGQNMLLTFGNIRDEVGKGNDIFTQASGLMTDLSAGMGTSMKGSAIQLGKALQDPIKGTTALGRAGVQFTEDQTAQIEKMVESGDVLGAQKVILGEVGKQFEGAAEQMASPADRAKVAWGNFQETIGTALLPVVDKVLTAFAEFLPVALKWGHVFADVIGPYIEDAIGFVKLFVDNITGSSSQMSETADTFSGVFTDIKSIVSSVVAIVTVLWRTFGDDILRYAKTAFGALIQILGGAFKIIRGIFDVIAGLLTGDWARVWDGIKSILSGAWQVILGLVKLGLGMIRLALSTGWQIIKGIFGRAWGGITSLVGKGVDALVKYVRSLPGRFVDSLRTLGSILRDIFSKAFGVAKQMVTDGIDNIVAAVKAIPGRLGQLGGILRDAGKELIENFIRGLGVVGNVASDLAQTIWDAIKGLINAGIDKLNDLLEFSIDVGPKTFTVNPPDIGQLAGGGRVTGGTLALIGEGREPETVLPDSMLRGLLERAHDSGGRVAALTITNWRDGTGYFRMLADESVGDDASMRRDLGVMRRA